MKLQDKEKIKKIRADIKASSIPEELKVLYLLANAVEIISQQFLLRLKSVYARHGYKIKDNDMLTGLNQYCAYQKMAAFQFFERIDPAIINATWGADRDEDDPNAPGNAAAMDSFNEDANEIIRLVYLYIDRTSRNNEGFAKVFKTLRQLPSCGLDANGQVEYRPEHHCVIRFAGRNLYCFIGDSFERVVRDAFVKAVECGLVLHC